MTDRLRVEKRLPRGPLLFRWRRPSGPSVLNTAGAPAWWLRVRLAGPNSPLVRKRLQSDGDSAGPEGSNGRTPDTHR